MKLLKVHLPRNNKKIKRNVLFCGKLGHVKKDCTKYYAWSAKKGTSISLVYSEANLSSVQRNTWWLDSASTTHISVSMQGCQNFRKPNNAGRHIFVGDDKSVEVEAIGYFR